MGKDLHRQPDNRIVICGRSSPQLTPSCEDVFRSYETCCRHTSCAGCDIVLDALSEIRRASRSRTSSSPSSTCEVESLRSHCLVALPAPGPKQLTCRGACTQASHCGCCCPCAMLRRDGEREFDAIGANNLAWASKQGPKHFGSGLPVRDGEDLDEYLVDIQTKN